MKFEAESCEKSLQRVEGQQWQAAARSSAGSDAAASVGSQDRNDHKQRQDKQNQGRQQAQGAEVLRFSRSPRVSG